MDTTAISRAISAIGSQRELADRIHVTPSLVSQWATGHRPTAAHHVIAIETATHGVVTRYDLRPDVFGAAPEAQEKAA